MENIGAPAHEKTLISMKKDNRLLRKRCETFTSIVSRLDLRVLNERQRRVAELRIAGSSLEAIGERLGVSTGRVYQIEARLRTRARLIIQGSS